VIAMLSFFFVANYTLTYASLFVLRKKEPQMERPYRAWGYRGLRECAACIVLFLISVARAGLEQCVHAGQVLAA